MWPDDLQGIAFAVMKSLSPFIPPPAQFSSAPRQQLTQPPRQQLTQPPRQQPTQPPRQQLTQPPRQQLTQPPPLLTDNFEYFDSNSSSDNTGSFSHDVGARQPKTQKTRNNPHCNRPLLA